MTDADLIDALTAVYGPALLASTPMSTGVALPTDEPSIGRWGDDDTLVRLWRETYPDRLRLTITAVASDQAMQEATAAGVKLDSLDAPARDLARRTAEAAALRTRDENIRRGNKATFKP